jgi:hypothetical protein
MGMRFALSSQMSARSPEEKRNFAFKTRSGKTESVTADIVCRLLKLRRLRVL